MTSGVDDAVQEALLVVARRLRSLKTAASFAGWLFTVVRRECQRLSRRTLAHEELDQDRIEDQLAARPMDELRMGVAFALESWPAHYFEMILLRDVEELTIAEICEGLGLTVVAMIKARLHWVRLSVGDYYFSAEEEAAHLARRLRRQSDILTCR